MRLNFYYLKIIRFLHPRYHPKIIKKSVYSVYFRLPPIEYFSVFVFLSSELLAVSFSFDSMKLFIIFDILTHTFVLIIVVCQQSCVENYAFKLENLDNSISTYQITSDDGVLFSELVHMHKNVHFYTSPVTSYFSVFAL